MVIVQTAGSPRLYVVHFGRFTAGWCRNFWLLLRTLLFRTSRRMPTIFLMLLKILFSPSRSSCHDRFLAKSFQLILHYLGHIRRYDSSYRKRLRETQIQLFWRFCCRSITSWAMLVGLNTVGIKVASELILSDSHCLRNSCSRTLHVKYTLQNLENLSFLLNLICRPTSLKAGPARNMWVSQSG
jgi:hypothetical protein